jgi:hypothetical protein
MRWEQEEISDVLDGERVGSVELNDTFETPMEAGKTILPVFPLSFFVPSLALSLHRE